MTNCNSVWNGTGIFHKVFVSHHTIWKFLDKQNEKSDYYNTATGRTIKKNYLINQDRKITMLGIIRTTKTIIKLQNIYVQIAITWNCALKINLTVLIKLYQMYKLNWNTCTSTIFLIHRVFHINLANSNRRQKKAIDELNEFSLVENTFGLFHDYWHKYRVDETLLLIIIYFVNGMSVDFKQSSSFPNSSGNTRTSFPGDRNFFFYYNSRTFLCITHLTLHYRHWVDFFIKVYQKLQFQS